MTSTCLCKCIFIGMLLFIHGLSIVAFEPQEQTGVVPAETVWPQSLKYLLFDPLKEKFANF